MIKNMGEAYAFFDCDASKEEIEGSMSAIRADARTPGGLQLVLREGIAGLTLDEELAEGVYAPGDYRVMGSGRFREDLPVERKPLSDMNYSLHARYKGAPNELAAEELADIMTTVMRKFNRDQTMFRGAIVYESGGQYQLYT